MPIEFYRHLSDADLAAIIAYLRAQPSAPTLGQAEEYFKGSGHEAAIEDALGEALLQQAEGQGLDLDLEAEVANLVERLSNDRNARRQSEILGRLAAGTASDDERREYQALMAALKSGNPDPETQPKV